MPSDGQQFTGSALIVEGAIIGILGSNILTFNTGWQWDWLFEAAFTLLFVLYVIRTASTLVEDPNLSRIRRTTPWSAICLQFCIVGVTASAATQLTELYPAVDELLLWLTLTGGGVIAVIVIDEIFLGAFIREWIEIIDDNAGDDYIGERLREMTKWVENTLDAVSRPSDSPSFNYRRGIILTVILGGIFAVVSSPVWFLGAGILGSTWMSFLVVFILVMVRDTTRYLYLKLGPARTFEDVKTSVSVSVLVVLINIVLVAGSLGIPF